MLQLGLMLVGLGSVFFAVFSFLYLKKLKFQKYMTVLENFKNIPRSPYGEATGLKCNFFSSNLQRSPWRKKKRGGPVARLGGDRPLSPVGGSDRVLCAAKAY